MRSEKIPAVYIMASGFHGTLYTGVTSDLPGRVWQHRSGAFRGFTDRYGRKRLVWFEAGGDMDAAIAREKQVKKWRREWKLALIEADNPEWRDLAEDFGFEPLPKTPGAGAANAGHDDPTQTRHAEHAQARHAGLDPASTLPLAETDKNKVDPGSSPG